MALQPFHGLWLSWSFAIAIVGQLILGVYLQGRFWQGGRNPETVRPAVYPPTVAQHFVAGTAAANFGFPQLGILFFGAGLLSWLSIESVILHRATVHEPLVVGRRQTLGIQLAPPVVVGGVTYLSLPSIAADLFAFALLGYVLYQALLLLRLLPWIRAQAFAPSNWGFSFGVAPLPTLAMRIVERGGTGPVQYLAPVLFIAANLVIGLFAVKTVGLLLQGRLFPLATIPAP